MKLEKRTEGSIDRLQISDPEVIELFSGELLTAIVTGRSLPWAWRDQRDPQLIRMADDYGTTLTYRILGHDAELDTWRLQLEPFGPALV